LVFFFFLFLRPSSLPSLSHLLPSAVVCKSVRVGEKEKEETKGESVIKSRR
jgi:hypothetical protein